MPTASCPVATLTTIVATHLQDTAQVLATVPQAIYADITTGSSIGQHVRHCLDHVRALVEALEQGHAEVDYEQRHRGCPSEVDADMAHQTFTSLAERLAAIPIGAIERELGSRAMVSPDLPPHTLASTGTRELGFLLSHGIHHNAIIGHLMKQAGIPVPAGFGYAPSTIAFQAEQS